MSIDDQCKVARTQSNRKITRHRYRYVKRAVIKDLSYVSKMDVKEYTLYQKMCEVHDKYPTEEVNSFFDDKPH